MDEQPIRQGFEGVYQVARRYLVPAITHQTKAREDRHILDCFQSGDYPVVTSERRRQHHAYR